MNIQKLFNKNKQLQDDLISSLDKSLIDLKKQNDTLNSELKLLSSNNNFNIKNKYNSNQEQQFPISHGKISNIFNPKEFEVNDDNDDDISINIYSPIDSFSIDQKQNEKFNSNEIPHINSLQIDQRNISKAKIKKANIKKAFSNVTENFISEIYKQRKFKIFKHQSFQEYSIIKLNKNNLNNNNKQYEKDEYQLPSLKNSKSSSKKIILEYLKSKSDYDNKFTQIYDNKLNTKIALVGGLGNFNKNINTNINKNVSKFIKSKLLEQFQPIKVEEKYTKNEYGHEFLSKSINNNDNQFQHDYHDLLDTKTEYDSMISIENSTQKKYEIREKRSTSLKSKSTKILDNKKMNYIDPNIFNIHDNYDDVTNIFIDSIDQIFYIFEPIEFSIPENSLFSFIWSSLITIILFFQIVSFPFETQSEPSLNKNETYLIINVIFEYSFIIDIVINFFTLQRDKYGKLVKNLNEIFRNQLKTWFLLDVISSVPSNNFVYFGLINEGSDQNNQIKLLKMPKYLRVIRGMMNVFESRVSSFVHLDSIINISNSDQAKNINILKFSVQFFLICNMLTCQLISQVQLCKSAEECTNWFQDLIQIYQYRALQNPSDVQQSYAKKIELIHNEFGPVHFQNHIITKDRKLLYFDAWYFVVQTVTTVGQGDINNFTPDERVFRSICMIIGCIIFALISSNILEALITESLNIYRRNEHEVMIEKIQNKYNIIGDPKRQLNLLGDSVYTENLESELKFTRLLPQFMQDIVLKCIWKTQLNKIPLLQEESLGFFVQMMRVSKFRRCVFSETIGDEENISIIQSGQIGCQVANIRQYMNQDHLYNYNVGDELGQYNYINFKGSYSNYMYNCTTNSEIVEISTSDYLRLMMGSLKGVQYVYRGVIDFLFELQMMISLYYSMLKAGFYIEYKWYKKVMIMMKFNGNDEQNMEVLFKNIISKISQLQLENSLQEKQLSKGKWQANILTNEIHRQIINKAKDLLSHVIRKDQEILTLQNKL